MQTIALKLNSYELHGLFDLIGEVIKATKPIDLEDKLLLAVLARLHKRLATKLYDAKDCSIQLGADEALALVIVYDRADMDVTTQVGNMMLLMSNQIQQQFN